MGGESGRAQGEGGRAAGRNEEKGN